MDMKNLKIPKPNGISDATWLHIVIGFPIGMIAFVGSHILWESLWLSIGLAILAGATAGFVKEILDKLNPKKKLFDPMDIVASAIGSFSGGLFALIVYLIFG